MTNTIVTHTTTYNLLDLPQQETVGSTIVIDRKYASDGTVIQVNHYYPYGGLIIDPRHTISSTNASDSRYRFTGKELSEESGEYDFGARFLDPIPGRFTTIDPLAEKYYSLSPYAYCAGNPVYLVDPEGEKWYSVNTNGYITVVDDMQDGTDRLYSNYPQWGIGPQMNTDYIEISDPTILSSLTVDYTDSFGGIIHYAKTKSKSIDDLFLFFADNTSVEWSFEKYRTGTFVLATSNNMYSSSTGRNIVTDEEAYALNDNTLIMSLHSHPRPDGTKGASMNVGYGYSDMLNIINYSNRWYESHNQSLSGFPLHYVYHKQSHALYNYTPYNNSIFIKSVSSGKDLRFP